MLHNWETSNWRLVAFLFLCGSLSLSLALSASLTSPSPNLALLCLPPLVKI